MKKTFLLVFTLTLVFALARTASAGEVLGDFDGDHLSDIAVYRAPLQPGQSSTWYILQSMTNSLRAVQWGTNGDIPLPFDYDGDDKADVAVARPSQNLTSFTWYILKSFNNQLRVEQWGSPMLGDQPLPGDYDGDGMTDIAVVRLSNYTWYILQSSNSQLRAQQWGVEDDEPVPFGDYDGDNKVDVAVRRYDQNGSTFLILRSMTNSLLAKQWGTFEDETAPVDFDGDGKADIAVWRPSTGTWYVSRSLDGGFQSRAFGSTDDTPLPGDFDGDGKADYVVYRGGTFANPQSVWYILQSSNNLFRAVPWGQQGDYPL